MWYRVLFVVGFFLACSGSARAQIDAEPKTAYPWRIVVKAEAHPLLSPSFRAQLRRDLEAALQPALDKLGSVEVIDLAEFPRDKWDPLLQQFEDKGFAALDTPRDLTGTKTHFLKLDYRDSQYHLEARQYDGFAGLASPILRKQSVRAPELVGRTAGLMIDRDFGLTGTIDVVTVPRGTEVKELKVTVRGGQLGSLDRFVKIGDVFTMSQIVKTNRPAPPPIRTATGKIIAPPPGTVLPPGLTANPRAFTLLRVTEVGKDGSLKCGVLSRYENPAGPAGGVIGYRCIRLGTVEAPLTVRLVTTDPAYQKSVGLVTVSATETGFGTPNAGDTFIFKDGLFRSDRPLSNVACVTVSRGGTRSVRFPVAVLGTDAVNLPYETNEALEREAEYIREVLAAGARVADARLAQTICFEITAKLIEKQKNADALARAKGGYQSADAVDKSLADDLARLKDQPEKTAATGKLLANVEQQLVALRQFNAALDKHVKTLEAVVARESDPRIALRDVQAQAAAERITLLRAGGDIKEALDAYDQLLALLPGNAEVTAARDKLKAEWTPKNDAHAKARDYLLKTWPAIATIPDFKDSLPQIGAAVEECKRQNDRHTLRKLLTIFSAAVVKLNELVAPLDVNADADRKLLDDAKKAGGVLADLEIKITEFVKAGGE